MAARDPKDDDRRRAPRQPTARGTRGQIRSTVQVEIVDVSAVGLRLELSTSLRPGSVYEVKADIGGYAISVPVRITRCSAGGYRDDGKGGRLLLFRAGGEFLWGDEAEQASFAAFLERSRNARPPSSSGILRPR